ncbi:MAG: inositol monophosphatase family protein [Candidatus Coatesbacteria bacterium]
MPDELAVALRAAGAAGAVAMRAFGRKVRVERKADDTPVTVFDRAAEEAARRVIARAFPSDGVLGEEHGATRTGADARWLIDPIDGTKSFIRGLPYWGTLVAREVRGRLTAGVIALPAMGRTIWAARGRGAFLNGRRVRVSRQGALRGACVLHADLDTFVRYRALGVFDGIARRGAIIKAIGDCPAYVWLGSGCVEAMIEPEVDPWDIAAPRIIIEEAGGRVTDWKGRNSGGIRNVLATNGRIHAALLKILRAHRVRASRSN